MLWISLHKIRNHQITCWFIFPPSGVIFRKSLDWTVNVIAFYLPSTELPCVVDNLFVTHKGKFGGSPYSNCCNCSVNMEMENCVSEYYFYIHFYIYLVKKRIIWKLIKIWLQYFTVHRSSPTYSLTQWRNRRWYIYYISRQRCIIWQWRWCCNHLRMKWSSWQIHLSSLPPYYRNQKHNRYSNTFLAFEVLQNFAGIIDGWPVGKN